MSNAEYNFVLGRNPKNSSVKIWRLDFDAPELFVQSENSPELEINPKNRITQAGNYLLEWGAGEKAKTFDYALHEFNPTSKNPTGKSPVQKGSWGSWKFFYGHLDFGHYGNKHKDGPDTRRMEFVPMGNFILAWVGEPARGNFHLWNFDPGSKDPLQKGLHPDGAWGTIQQGHRLIGMGNNVISWNPSKRTYRLWSFDPKERKPIKEPVLQQGKWHDIDESHELVAIGDLILDWIPATREYRLWKFDPSSHNLLGKKPLKTGILPKGIDANMELIGIQPNRPVCDKQADIPGTNDYMRSKIKHVVYYMIENRSFDHVCGWLYENEDVPAHIIGQKGKFKGARESDFNIDAKGKKYQISKYKGGKLSKSYNLELLPSDPHHDHSDVMRQMFHPDEEGYKKRKKPNMGGFVINNAMKNIAPAQNPIMQTYGPKQLPVLNGLAKNFAISDEWFCSMPGGTDVNRAFSLTGSSFAMLDNFQNGIEYMNWPSTPRRPSIWKTLFSNGISDWKIYYSCMWKTHLFSYHLFLEGQIPSVDKIIAKAAAKASKGGKSSKPIKISTKHTDDIDQFLVDARTGNLPAFSFVEPVWVAPKGTTSYHPGHDLIVGEEKLKEIFEALQSGPNWDETLLVITFDEHGGIYDHVPPPYAKNPWPNDDSNGYKFDVMGVRVPTILVSPMINEKTVFRSDSDTAFDSTSFLATLLNWFGIPKSRWGLGDRTHAAPTFENVINRNNPRRDKVNLTLPYDGNYPAKAENIEPHDLVRSMANQTIIQLGKNKMNPNKLVEIARNISQKSNSMKELNQAINKFARKIR